MASRATTASDMKSVYSITYISICILLIVMVKEVPTQLWRSNLTPDLKSVTLSMVYKGQTIRDGSQIL